MKWRGYPYHYALLGLLLGLLLGWYCHTPPRPLLFIEGTGRVCDAPPDDGNVYVCVDGLVTATGALKPKPKPSE
jgi:hypothetical protein